MEKEKLIFNFSFLHSMDLFLEQTAIQISHISHELCIVVDG